MSKFLLIRTTKGISLLFPQNGSRRNQPPFSPPLSLMYIASSLEAAGHQVKILDLAFEHDSKEKLCNLLPTMDAVLMDITSGNLEESKALACFIKNIHPEIPIIIQGLFCAVQRQHALEGFQYADFCILLDGERIMPKVADAIEKASALSKVPGILYRENGHVKETKRRHELNNLDELPFPARHLVQTNEYGLINGVSLCQPRFTSMLTSRGCPCHCRFCSTHTIHGSFSQRTPKNILQEFQEIQEQYRSVMIEDDNFLANTQYANQILDGLIQAGSPLELFIAGARVDSADCMLYKKMAKAGVKLISFGIESGSQDVLDYYQKHITLQQIRNAIDLARAEGILTWGNFIFGAPIETKEHLRKTLKFSLTLPLDIAFYRQLWYQRGSSLWEEAVRENKLDEQTTFCYAGKTVSNFTESDLTKYCHRAFKRFYYRPTYLIREIWRCGQRKDFTFLHSLRALL